MSLPTDLIDAEVVCIASWNVDLTSHIPRPMARGETVLSHNFSIGPGGKGSNASVACARQGARVAVIARIGGDDFGRMALALWAKEGIDARLVEIAAEETSGVAQILVYEDGDNSIAVSPGAGARLAPAQVAAAADVLRRARVVMASCEVPVLATLEAFRIARSAGVLTLLNPAPAIPLPDELLALTDVLTPNETELHSLAALSANASVASAARILLERGVGAVVVTLGANGCELHRAAASPLRLSCHRVAVADTIGAGDTFTGVLAAALASGATTEFAVSRASAAAALSVTRHGAIGGMPGFGEVEQLLARSVGGSNVPSPSSSSPS